MASGGLPKEEEVSTSESLNKTFCVEPDILSFEETTTIYKKNQNSLNTVFSQKKHCTL